MRSDTIAPVPPYAALIFDCDGTLVDTGAAHFRALADALAPYAVKLDPAWYQARTGTSLPELLVELRVDHGIELDDAAILDGQLRGFYALVSTVTAIEVVTSVARANRGIVPLAVASGGRRAAVEASLQAAGISNLFDHLVTIEDVSRGKPEPDLFLLAADRLGVAAADCIVYEDSDEGLEAARRARMRAIDVRPFRHPVPTSAAERQGESGE